MDLLALYGILADTTELFRHDAVFEGAASARFPAQTTGNDIDPSALPHISMADGRLEIVSLCFLTAGVRRSEAMKHERELSDLLDSYPDPLRLAEGPSYIEVGDILDSHDAALRLFALGKVLGLWSIITPAVSGMVGKEAERMAQDGFLIISGWQGALNTRLFSYANRNI